MASCTIVAPGSTFTRPSPSRNRGFDVHWRRSWISACMTPMMAGPPYAVAPILRKLVAISFHVLANDSVIECHLRAAPGRARLLVDRDRGRDVLQRRARAVEDGDLVIARAARPPPGDHVAELRVDALARDQARGEGVLELADLGALLEDVDHEGGRGHQRRLQLLLAAIVGADGGDERPGPYVGNAQKRAARRRARDADVAGADGFAQVLPRLHGHAEARGGTRCERLGAGVVAVEDPHAPQRQDGGEGRELSLGLRAAADDGGRSRVATREELRGHRGG